MLMLTVCCDFLPVVLLFVGTVESQVFEPSKKGKLVCKIYLVVQEIQGKICVR